MARDIEAPIGHAPMHRRPSWIEAAPGQRNIPKSRTVFLAVLVGVLASMLLVDAYVSASFTPDPRARIAEQWDKVPDAARLGGAILDTTRNQLQTFKMPPKVMALTFDDGPSAHWTPMVLDVLRKHKVPATFFVIGGLVARYPDVTRAIVAEGSELGLHTFTHPDLSTISDWRRGIEYSQTEMAIAAATGLTTSLLRYPYSSSPDALANEDWPVAQDAGRRGYLTVLTDVDSDDWAEHNVNAIVKNATPPNDQGAIVLMHDAGGNRSKTVEALDKYIPAMEARGYRFVTISQGLQLALGGTLNGTGGTGTTAGPSASSSPGATGNPSNAANPGNTAKPSGAATPGAGASPSGAGSGLTTNPGGGTTVTSVPGEAPASRAEIFRGQCLVWTLRMSTAFIKSLEWVFIIVGLLTILRTLLMYVFAGYHAFTRRRRTFSWGPTVLSPVSVVVPAYNEKEGIVAAVRSLALGDYPVIDVVVVDDGSTDGTADLVERLRLPNVRVIRVPNGGKPKALNIGVAYARHDIIVMVDGDTILERDAIHHLVQPFADPRVGAVSGNVKVGNRTNILSRWQHIEYVIGFNLDRRMYDILQCMPTIPGAIGAFRRETLRQVHGVSSETLAEDTDLTIAICRAGWKVVYAEKARAWTEAPASLAQLIQQRYRWSYGTMQAMWKHRHSLVEKGPSGHFGRVGLPMLTVFGVALPLLAPLFDLFTVYGLLVYNKAETGLAWVAMLGFQFLTALLAFALDKEKVTPLWALPLQQFVYRQIMYLVIIRSTLTALTGARLRWHKLRRMGQTGIPSGNRA